MCTPARSTCCSTSRTPQGSAPLAPCIAPPCIQTKVLRIEFSCLARVKYISVAAQRCSLPAAARRRPTYRSFLSLDIIMLITCHGAPIGTTACLPSRRLPVGLPAGHPSLSRLPLKNNRLTGSDGSGGGRTSAALRILKRGAAAVTRAAAGQACRSYSGVCPTARRAVVAPLPLCCHCLWSLCCCCGMLQTRRLLAVLGLLQVLGQRAGPGCCCSGGHGSCDLIRYCKPGVAIDTCLSMLGLLTSSFL